MVLQVRKKEEEECHSPSASEPHGDGGPRRYVDCVRSLDSAILGGSTTVSRDDGAEADCDGRGNCASPKSAAAAPGA